MTIIITVAICILVFFTVVLIWFLRFTIKKPPFILKIKIPERVSSDESFQVAFIIKNLNDKIKKLESIDIYKSFISNFTIEKLESDIINKKEFINFVSFYINKELLPLQSESVTLLLRPVNKGSFSGDVIIMTPQNEITHSAIGIIVY